MTNLEALYRNICQFPDENSYRLIYADCLDETDDNDNKTLAEYIRLSIALENPPQEASMVSISEWKSRETLGAEMVKRMWRKWTECVCSRCDGNGKHWIKDANDNRTYPGDDIPYLCRTCNGTGDILKEKIQTDTQEETMTGSVVTAQATAEQPRRMSFRRGFLNAVYAQRLEDVWKDGEPTLWADALVRHTPIDIIMANDLHPSSLRVGSGRKDYKYRWFMADNENQLVMGRIQKELFRIMWSMANKDETIDPNVIQYSSPQEAKSLCGRALGRMVREAVYPKATEAKDYNQMASFLDQRK